MWQEPLTHRAKKFRKKSSSLSLWCNNSRKERKSSSQSLGPCSLYAEVRPDYRAACVVCCCRNIWGSVQTYLSLMHHCDAARALQREQYGAASLTSASTRSYQAHNERLNDQTPFPPPGHSPMVLIQSCVSAFDAHSSPTQSRHCHPPPHYLPAPPSLDTESCLVCQGSRLLRVSTCVCPSCLSLSLTLTCYGHAPLLRSVDQWRWNEDIWLAALTLTDKSTPRIVFINHN